MKFVQGNEYRIIGEIVITLRHDKVVVKDTLSNYLERKREERRVTKCFLSNAERAAIIDQCIDIEKRFDALYIENTIPYKIELIQQYKDLTVLLGFKDRELYPIEERKSLY